MKESTIKPQLVDALGATRLRDWQFKTYRYGDGKCACGQTILHRYYFEHEGKEIIVGSTCRYHFPKYILARNIVKIATDPLKGMTDGWLVIDFDFLSEWERKFYSDTYSKRNMTLEQLKWRYIINKKICAQYDVEVQLSQNMEELI